MARGGEWNSGMDISENGEIFFCLCKELPDDVYIEASFLQAFSLSCESACDLKKISYLCMERGEVCWFSAERRKAAVASIVSETKLDARARLCTNAGCVYLQETLNGYHLPPSTPANNDEYVCESDCGEFSALL